MTDQLNQLQAKFEQKKAEYLAKEPQLKALEAEKTQSENIKAALENELCEIVEKTKSALSAAKVLSADEYAELKTADFNVKTKIEYYQALIEEQEEKIYQCKEALFNQRKEILFVRRDIFKILAEERLKEMQDKINDILNLLYFANLANYEPLSGLEEPEDNAVKQITEYIERLGRKERTMPDNFGVKSLTGDFKPKSPMQKHKERIEKEQGLIQAKGFEKLMNNLTN